MVTGSRTISAECPYIARCPNTRTLREHFAKPVGQRGIPDEGLVGQYDDVCLTGGRNCTIRMSYDEGQRVSKGGND
jgi:hypothetical protein